MSPRRSIELAALLACAVVAACAQGTAYDDDDDDGTTSPSTSSSGSSPTGSGTGGTSSGTTTTGTAVGGTGGTGLGGAGAAAGTGPGGSGGTGGTSPGSCIHDLCDIGLPLTSGCDSCVTQVCANDSYCCDTEWDDTCLDEVWDYCGIDCWGGGGGSGAIGPGDLVINEIMNNPAVVSDASGEWFELYNDSASTIELQGLVIRHQSPSVDPNAVHTIGSSVTVAPGGYAVLGLNATTSTNGNVSVDYEYPGSVNLGNTADYLAIETSSQVIIDETSWDQASGLDPDGRSRSLDPSARSATTNDDDTNFCEATSFVTGSSGDRGTPGLGNDDCT
ncbi:MAG: lamin tail domain-containing protein [Deltaproteobacteria bacterium]|jgi:hypothetical protein|nr:lamin tail domain-containing protein [Deltaproteobacteria bacterium]MBW2531005.1 lamin tail domain-containing protein [Deltaproteobacteria bacterium]